MCEEDGDPRSNAIAAWLTEQGVPRVHVLRFRARDVVLWQDERGRAYAPEIMEEWQEETWDSIKRNRFYGKGSRGQALTYKVTWKNGAWVPYDPADDES